MNKNLKKLIIGLLILMVLSPIGLFLPELFHAGDAWGEWSTETVKEDVGYVPEGMEKDAETYKAPLPDYSNGNNKNSLASNSLYYIFSGFVGIGIIGLATFALYKAVKRNE
jgi:hypothetical protein